MIIEQLEAWELMVQTNYISGKTNSPILENNNKKLLNFKLQQN